MGSIYPPAPRVTARSAWDSPLHTLGTPLLMTVTAVHGLSMQSAVCDGALGSSLPVYPGWRSFCRPGLLLPVTVPQSDLL